MSLKGNEALCRRVVLHLHHLALIRVANVNPPSVSVMWSVPWVSDFSDVCRIPNYTVLQNRWIIFTFKSSFHWVDAVHTLLQWIDDPSICSDMKSDEKSKFVGFPFSTSRQNDHPHAPSAHSPLIKALRSYVNLGWIYGASLWDKDNCLMSEVVSSMGKARAIGPLRRGGGGGEQCVWIRGRGDRVSVVLEELFV